MNRIFQVLRARNNSISILPSENIPSLKILDLSYNSLRTVPSAVTSQNLPLLQELYLDGNPISSLKFHQNAPFQDLKVISLSHLANVQNIEFASFQGWAWASFAVNNEKSRQLTFPFVSQGASTIGP